MVLLTQKERHNIDLLTADIKLNNNWSDHTLKLVLLGWLAKAKEDIIREHLKLAKT